MKKYILCFVALSGLALASLSILAQATHESSPQIRRKTFEKVWKTVNDKYFDSNFGGINRQSVHERYLPQIAAVKTDDELYEVLAKMLGEIKTSHLEIIPPEYIREFTTPPITTGLDLREIDGQIVVRRILSNSSADASQIRPGFVIEKINGELPENINDASERLVGQAGTKVSISYLDANNEKYEVMLERQMLALNEIDKEKAGQGAVIYARFDSSILGDGIGYIHFTNFIVPLEKKIQAAIESMKNAPGIIIDLRANGGGDDKLGIKMAGMLFDKKIQLIISRRRKGDDFYYQAKPTKHPYLGKVVILVDEQSGSASEQFTAGMQEAGRAFVIGKKTKGADLDADFEKLPTGAIFIYAIGEPRTTKGIVIEGRGVMPNQEINLTRQDLLTGKDPQLQAAIDYIKTSQP